MYTQLIARLAIVVVAFYAVFISYREIDLGFSLFDAGQRGLAVKAMAWGTAGIYSSLGLTAFALFAG